jgi:hypothetical protein
LKEKSGRLTTRPGPPAVVAIAVAPFTKAELAVLNSGSRAFAPVVCGTGPVLLKARVFGSIAAATKNDCTRNPPEAESPEHDAPAGRRVENGVVGVPVLRAAPGLVRALCGTVRESDNALVASADAWGSLRRTAWEMLTPNTAIATTAAARTRS